MLPDEVLPFLGAGEKGTDRVPNILLLKPPLNHSVPKGSERNRDLTLAVIFGDTNEELLLKEVTKNL